MGIHNIETHILRAGLSYLEASWDQLASQYDLLETSEEVVNYFGFWVDSPNKLTHFQLVEARNKAFDKMGLGRGYLDELVRLSYEIESINEELYERSREISFT